MKPYFMRRLFLILTFLIFPAMLGAQSIVPMLALDSPPTVSFSTPGTVPVVASDSVLVLEPSLAMARMSPDLALETYQKQANRQAQVLAGYSAATMIRAQLPASSQHGEFELERRYTAPRTLAFKPVHFEGDGFVKTNVIARILQSEVDHVQKDDPTTTALRPENYKFSHKGTSQIAGRAVHVFQVKPRKKRPGLFKGQIYLDAYTGSLVRVEGRVVKSPSLFVKKIDFIQEYSDINGFTFPVRMHSQAKAALVGPTVIDIEIRDYQPISTPLQSQVVSGSY
jgi:hypothetical protein